MLPVSLKKGKFEHFYSMSQLIFEVLLQKSTLCPAVSNFKSLSK